MTSSLQFDTDTTTLIFASYGLAMLAGILIVALWLSKPLRAKHPRLLSLAVWSLMAALLIAALVAGGVV